MNIYHIIEQIQKHKLTRADCEKLYPDFFKSHPTLSNAIFETNFDFQTLLYMLKKKHEIDDKSTSQHDASVDVGSLLVDKFVKPNL
jgi:hypothetical protein